MNRARASITLGRPRAIRQVPGGTSIGAVSTMPTSPQDREAGARREREHQLVGAQLEGAGRQGDPQARPRDPHVRGVVAAADRRGEGGVVDPAPGVGEHGQGDQHRRHHAPEHPAPGEVGGEPRRHGRPEQRGEHPGGRHVGEQPRADRLGVDPAGDDVEHHHEQPAAQAGEGPAGEEERQVGGEAAHRRTGREQDLPGDRADHRAGPVGPHAGEHDAEQLGGEHDREGEPVGAHGIEVAGHGGHRRGHRHRLEGDDGDEGQNGQGDLEVGPAERPLDGGGRRVSHQIHPSPGDRVRRAGRGDGHARRARRAARRCGR